MMRWIAFVLAVWPVSAFADSIDPDWARGTLVKVRTGSTRYFYSGSETGCPSLTAKCKRMAYLVPGDLIVAYQRQGPFTRVEYVNAAGRTTWGYLETAALEPARVKPAAWAGAWRGTEHSIRIFPTRVPGRFRVTGEATWGRSDPERVRNGGVNEGSFEGFITPGANGANLSEGDGELACRVKLRLLGPYLLVTDNLNCGGLNVSFRGVYRK